ncbi:burp domain-containing protein 3 [Quercus suber]|uniref:Burp domain-containing protein 3 n=1 Tax=Quercus suber TaxID=58331 RepID=A0AAW0LQ40_QUESU
MHMPWNDENLYETNIVDSNPVVCMVALVASHAAVPPEKYWNSMLPNTPMPKALSDLLQPGWYFESERTSLASFH